MDKRLMFLGSALGEQSLTDAATQKNIRLRAKALAEALEKREAGQVTAALRTRGALCCLSRTVVKRAQALWSRAEGIEEALQRLNDEGIGGGRLRLEGRVVVGEYMRCYCGCAKAGVKLPSVYCECSAGWFEGVFTAMTGKATSVTLERSILDGANSCRFQIQWEGMENDG